MITTEKKIKAKYTHSHISTTKEKAPRRSFLDGCIGGQTSFRRRSEHAKRRGRVISKQASMTFFFFLRFFSSALTLNYLSKIYLFIFADLPPYVLMAGVNGVLPELFPFPSSTIFLDSLKSLGKKRKRGYCNLK